MADHFIMYCKYCRKVMAQCRCPSPYKQVKWGVCKGCENESTPTAETLIEAERIARHAHRDQKRWSGESYIIHPYAVANSFNEEEIEYKIVGWLHDVIEDTTYSYMQLLDLNIPKYLVDAVRLITKVDGQNYYDFIMKIAQNDIASRVKIADINHNMSDLKEGSLKDKYRLAKHVLETFIKQDLL